MKEITTEVIDALRYLRVAAHGQVGVTSPVADAFKALDNADVFDRIDEVADGKADVPLRDRTECAFEVDLVYHTVTDSKKTDSKIHSTIVTTSDEEQALQRATEQLRRVLTHAGFLGDGVELVVTGGTTNPFPL